MTRRDRTKHADSESAEKVSLENHVKTCTEVPQLPQSETPNVMNGVEKCEEQDRDDR